MKYKEYLRTEHWQHLRYQAQKRDGFKCCRCGWHRQLEVHHKFYPRNIFETILADLETLCARCHDEHHHGKQPKKLVKDLSKKLLKSRRKLQRRLGKEYYMRASLERSATTYKPRWQSKAQF